MSIQIFYEDDSANIEERKYWHHQHQTYDYEFLIGPPTNIGLDEYHEGSHSENVDTMSNYSTEQSPFSSNRSETGKNQEKHLQDQWSHLSLSHSSKKKKQQILEPGNASKKHSRDYNCQELRNSGILHPFQLEKMKENGKIKGSEKTDQYMFSYLGAVAFYNQNKEDEVKSLRLIISKLNLRIIKVKRENQGLYSQFGNQASRWMKGFCMAIEKLINYIERGQEDREEMVGKMIKEYYIQGSNSPNRKRDKDVRKNKNAYLQSFKQ